VIAVIALGQPPHASRVYVAEPRTPDYDAMIRLDMTAPATPQTSQHNNSGPDPLEFHDHGTLFVISTNRIT
jgi:hypothetical protein